MPTNLQLTGKVSFSSPLTYGKSIRINQIIRVTDEDAVKLLTLPNTFTTYVGPLPIAHDFTDDANEGQFRDGSVTITPGMLAVAPNKPRRGILLRNADGYPYGTSDGLGGYKPLISDELIASIESLTAPDSVLAKVLGGSTNIPAGAYQLAARSSQAGVGPILDQSAAMRDMLTSGLLFPPAWAVGQTIAIGSYRVPLIPNGNVYRSGTAATTSGAEPAWPLIPGNTVTDAAGITWTCQRGPWAFNEPMLPPMRANSTAYAVGNFMSPVPANGFVYRCTVAGTSAGSQPVLTTTIGQTTVDGSVTWICDSARSFGGVRHFRSLAQGQIGSPAAMNFGMLNWDMAAGDSLIVSLTAAQNYTHSGFVEQVCVGNRHQSGSGKGVSLIATGASVYNDLRIRVTDGTVTRTVGHFDGSGGAHARPGDGQMRTSTFFIDGKTKRVYLYGDGVARSNPAHYAALGGTEVLGWDGNLAAVTGSTQATTPLWFGGVPDNTGAAATSLEFGATRFDVLVLPNQGLPVNLTPIAQWFHNRGETLLPASLLLG